MRFIENNEQLKQYIPNALKEATGERSYFEKILPHLVAAEKWLISEIIGEDMVDEITVSQSMSVHATSAIVSEALYQAIPGLDLVLTPNGYGVVSSGNLTPASRDRVNRLRDSLIAQRDYNIDRLLLKLSNVESWPDSERGRYFTGTLFCHPGAVHLNCSYKDYTEFIESAREIEQELAQNVISPELHAVLLKGNLSLKQARIAEMARHYVRKVITVTNDDVLYWIRCDIVNLIRRNPDSFPEWFASETSALYNPPVFKNKKKSGGYFF